MLKLLNKLNRKLQKFIVRILGLSSFAAINDYAKRQNDIARKVEKQNKRKKK